MKGKLTLYTEETSGFFFHTACEIERGENRVQIQFEESLPPIMRQVHTIGLTPYNISVLGAREFSYVPEGASQSRLGVLIQLDTREADYRVAEVYFMGMDLIVEAEGMTVSLDGKVIHASVPCYICKQHKKDKKFTLFLECYEL